MELQKVMESDYRFVRETWGEASIEPLQYIDFLAGTLRKDTRSWPVDPFLGADGKPVTDRNIINKTFMELCASFEAQMPQAQGAPAATSIEITQALEQQIIGLTTARTDRLLRESRTAQQNINNQIGALSEQYRNKLSELRDANARISQLVSAAADATIVERIKNVCKDGFYVFKGVEGSLIKFETARSIMLSYTKPGEREPLIVDVGRFRVFVDPSSYFPKVKSLEGNATVFNHIHPHINSSDGSVCWGEIRGLVNRASTQGDLETMMSATKDLLCSYNDGNPFQKFEWFYYFAALREMDPGKAWWTGDGKTSALWQCKNEDVLYRMEEAMTRILRARPARKVDLRELAPFLEEMFLRRRYPAWEPGTSTVVLSAPGVAAAGTPPGPGSVNRNGLSFSHNIERTVLDEDGEETDEEESVAIFGPLSNDPTDENNSVYQLMDGAEVDYDGSEY